MTRPIPELNRAIRDILTHVEALPPEANVPITHYYAAGTGSNYLLKSVDQGFDLLESLPPAIKAQHLARLHGMVVVSLIEAFERYLKEAAASCIDLVGPFVFDDRFVDFKPQGSHLATHFGAGSLGGALCESLTWTNTTTVNNRFKDVLSDPFEEGQFEPLPRGKKDSADRTRFETLELLWQLRHTLVHNVGVVTRSDAVKFRLMVKAEVAAPRLVAPTRGDIIYIKQFLDDTTMEVNKNIAKQAALVMTALHSADPTLFIPQDMADRVAQIFGVEVTLAGASGTPPPP